MERNCKRVLKKIVSILGNLLLKRFDAELGLIYFGKRYYDLSIGTDPADFVDSVNPYQYVFNNHYRFQDPSRENVVGLLFEIVQIIAGGAIMASGCAQLF